MSCQLFTDCFNEIFEYLKKDKITLHSCLLVNRLWCHLAVRILWMNVWRSYYHIPYRVYVPLSILSTLIACLPDESKDLLNMNGIIFLPPTSKPPLFNYPSFCKNFSIYEIDHMIGCVLKDQLI